MNKKTIVSAFDCIALKLKVLVKDKESEVSVNFEKEYKKIPVVTASLNAAGALKPDEVSLYVIYYIDIHGFKIKLSKPAASDLLFSWMALAVTKTQPHPMQFLRVHHQ